MYCTDCGHNNVEDANYCAKCGAYLVGDQNTDTIQMVVPGVGRNPESNVPVEPSGGKGAALVIRSGGGREGERFRILDKTTIGRSPTSDIFLDDVTVSREHAVVYNDGITIRIEDRASLNGTFVNSERVEKQTLATGDEIQIGKYKLTYLAE
ncbi:MAG: FHA domain-containing protein [Gaiellales bacterium]